MPALAPPASIVAAVQSFIQTVRLQAADGLTLAEIGSATRGLLKLLVHTAELIGGVPGSQRKAWVMEAAEYFFDSVVQPAVPLFLRPVWWIVQPAVRAMYLSLCSELVELLVAEMKKETTA